MTPADLAIDSAKNRIDVAGEVAVIWLNKGFALINTDDIPLISQFRWSVTFGKSGPKYARAYLGGGRKNGKYVRLHRFLLNPEDNQDIDHINGDGLDNRRSNLRLLSRSENLINSGTPKNNKSGIRGVSWHSPYGKWKASIQVSGKNKNLGYFFDKEDAASARHAAEELYFPGANRRIKI